MSLYNLVFGQNPLSRVLLACLGLREDSVGRFRDAFISDGKIAVYTRNGGGNRHCWHVDSPKSGSADCKHHDEQEEADEFEEVPLKGGLLTYRKTGRRVMETRHVCEEPDSEACACPGCVIQYRLRKHPHYITDRDDDFDSTYATIYFRFPPEFEADLKRLDSGEKFEPSERWQRALEAIAKGPS